MINTTYSLGDTLFLYDGAIQTVTVVGAVIDADTEDYFVTPIDGAQKFRVSKAQLFTSIDKLADKIVASAQSAFDEQIASIKANVEKALASFNAHLGA